MRVRVACAGALFLLFLAPPSEAAPLSAQAPARAAITVQQARAAVGEIVARIESDYVFAEKRKPLAAAIRAQLGLGRYDLTNAALLADRLTEDLRSTVHDKHLWVEYDPTSYDAVRRASNSQRADFSAQAAAARRRNQGIEELRILPGNVRYARITNFLWTPAVTPKVIDEAARFLGEGDGVIIDLRGNGGGSGAAVERLISYFLNPDNRVLMTFVEAGKRTVGRVSADLASPRMVGLPLFVLIDGGTGSAAEEFAYQVEQFKLGTLVGETTAGAANNNSELPVPPGFVFSISTGRPVHPISGTNWEGVGVPPDLKVRASEALDEAHLRLLQRLEAKAPALRGRYEWWALAIEARLHPPKLKRPQLEAYAGRYGIRSISTRNGQLLFKRDGSEAKALLALTPTIFAFPDSDDIRVRFKRAGGRVIGFDQITIDGDVISSERTAD